MSFSVLALFLGACSTFHTEFPESRSDFSNLTTRSFELPPFESVIIHAGSKINIQVGEAQSVKIATEEDHFSALRLDVKDGALTISHGRDHMGLRYVSIEITVPRLIALEIDGPMLAEVNNIDAEVFNLLVDGFGELILEGRCQTGRFDISAFGDFDASRLRCEDVYASVAGLGNFGIFASSQIDLKVTGLGDVTVYGEPTTVKERSRGLGSVNIRGQ